MISSFLFCSSHALPYFRDFVHALIHSFIHLFVHLFIYLFFNKAGYAATEVARGWAGAVIKGLPKLLGGSSNAKTAHNAEIADVDERTDQPMDIAGLKVACTRLETLIH